MAEKIIWLFDAHVRASNEVYKSHWCDKNMQCNFLEHCASKVFLYNVIRGHKTVTCNFDLVFDLSFLEFEVFQKCPIFKFAL